MSSKKDNISTIDNYFMKLALSIARDSDGLTGENPSVGCIITSNNALISYGTTSFNGRPHAEYNALKKIKKLNQKKTVYVTMEPCTHFGKTPPCTDLIIKSKIDRLVYSVEDADIRTKNKAFKILRSHGIKVKRSVLKKKVKEFYKRYFFSKKRSMPYVVGKIACSKDKFIINKKEKYITNKHSLNISHLLRYRNQGILVSYKTINNDNPSLDCRINGLHQFSPKRFILDRNLKSKINSKIFNDNLKNKTYILHSSKNLKKKNQFQKKKINLIRIKIDDNNNLNLKDALSKIYKKKVNSLIVEGGKILTNSFLSDNLFNEFYLFRGSKNLNKEGSINIAKTLKKLSINFKKREFLDTYTEKDKIIRFFNYV